ncbi:MAG: Sir2 family NAD-dependent protein deacetylase, partial [Rhodospirillales bacterium]|nr:Sir2 family NAD-dependent protein deacetylase [Rhodospirillales bacterium]
DFSEFVESPDARREYWTRKFDSHETITSAQPNRGHEAVAELVRRGAAGTVITQNIDGLHQKSGVPAEQVIELHGNTTYAACLECGARHELEPIREVFLTCGTLPVCRACGGIVKTATISFGQAMPARPCAARKTNRSAAICSCAWAPRSWSIRPRGFR